MPCNIRILADGGMIMIWSLDPDFGSSAKGGFGFTLYDSAGNVLHDHPVAQEDSSGSVYVSGDIYRIRFYSTGTDGFNGIIDVMKDGTSFPYVCTNCVHGTTTDLNKLYLDGDYSRAASAGVSGCDSECDFYIGQ